MPDQHKHPSKILRATSEQWVRWQAEAERDGLTLSAWIRRRLDLGGPALSFREVTKKRPKASK